jgi:hypothetical protein
VVTALGLTTCPVHAELKLTPTGPELVEIHTRFGGGNIVVLLNAVYGLRPFEEFLRALFRRERTAPDAHDPRLTWGVGFFTARIDDAPRWPSFAFPDPSSVVMVDVDARRRPKVDRIAGVRLHYWRAGHALFASADYAAVRRNVEFMRAICAPAA